MRKIVTGEQIAQLTNPDPFAVPTWRAPVYRTPGWIITLVQLFRLLAWWVRLIARHPAAATVAAVLILLWLNVGWIGLVVLFAWAGVVLATWRYFWPYSFTRWIGRPARGKWRGWWCYRRRWAGVMAISGVAPWHQGRIILPVLGKVSATKYTDRVAVRLVSGQSPADLAACAENLATGSARCCAGSARPGPGGWCWSSSAAMPWPRLSPACPSPPTRILGRYRSAGGRTACRGWSGCMARIC